MTCYDGQFCDVCLLPRQFYHGKFSKALRGEKKEKWKMKKEKRKEKKEQGELLIKLASYSGHLANVSEKQGFGTCSFTYPTYVYVNFTIPFPYR